MRLSIEDKLSVNKFFVDEDNAHIKVDEACADEIEMLKLVNACPAGLYALVEENQFTFDYAGCLECGTCRILGLGTVLKKWEYPEGSFGVEYRYG